MNIHKSFVDTTEKQWPYLAQIRVALPCSIAVYYLAHAVLVNDVHADRRVHHRDDPRGVASPVSKMKSRYNSHFEQWANVRRC